MSMKEKPFSKSLDRVTLRIFWDELLREPRLFYKSLINLIGILFISTVTPLLIGRMIASMAQPNGDPFGYLPYIIATAMIGVIANRYGFRAYLTSHARTLSRVQLNVYDLLLKRSVGFHNNHVSGKLVSDAAAYPNAFSQLHEMFMITLAPFAMILIGGLVVVSIASWQLGLVVLAMTIFTFASSYISEVKRKPIRRRRLETQKALTAHFADSIVNMQAVVTFAAENRERKTHKNFNEQLRDMRVHDWRMGSNNGNARIFVLYILQILLISVLVLQVRNNPDLLGVGIFTFIFTTMITNRLFDVDRFFRVTEEALLQAQPMTETIIEDVEISDAPNAKPLIVSEGVLELSHVDFGYPDANQEQSIFTDLNLSIASGEKIGLVGPSGGGKSTLTRLFLRFEDLRSGAITIDGQNIAEVTQSSLRKHIAYVPQDPLLFHRSIKENIAYGRPGASESDVVNAAKLAYAHDFIMSLPAGYDTVVGERGVKLSGGQRQRVAIARAILKDAPILILDEATSALDSESEMYIQDALRSLMEGRTTLVIAHRLSTIQKMDRIIVLDEGKIIEQGNHATLLKTNGLYAKLWARQSGGFIEE